MKIEMGDDGYWAEKIQECHIYGISQALKDDQDGSRFLVHQEDTSGNTMADYAPLLAVNKGYHWVIMHGSPGEICGIVSVEKEAKTFEHNLAVWIKPSHRQNNVGMRACRGAIDHAFSDGVPSIKMKVEKENEVTVIGLKSLLRGLNSELLEDAEDFVLWVARPVVCSVE